MSAWSLNPVPDDSGIGGIGTVESFGAMRPHDLLWLTLTMDDRVGDLPAWMNLSWPVVVRRAPVCPMGRIPVGARGMKRHQRRAGWVLPARIERVCSPENLAVSRGWRAHADRGVAAMDVLREVEPVMRELGLAWGPVGSVGFTLASGVPACHASSDLDLLVRAPEPLPAFILREMERLIRTASCRLDIQVDTPNGGFALSEWLHGRARVLLKTANGPCLVRDPWCALTGRGC